MSSLHFPFLNIIFLLLVSLSKSSMATRFNPNHNTTQKQKFTSFKILMKRLVHNPVLSATIDTNGFKSDVKFHTKEPGYYTDIFIGDPPRRFSLLIDTGSSLTWVRCFSCFEHDTCDSMGKQLSPERSKPFAPAACESDLCEMFSSQPLWECNENNECHCGMKYADETQVTGLLAKETFTIWDDDSITKVQVPDVPLLCANASTALYWLDGILGLGTRQDSFASVLEENFGITKFSYCLVDQIEEGKESSAMVFGEHILSRNNQVFYTPQLTSDSNAEHYAVKLVRISVDGVNIGVSSFPIDILIDTGATHSYLPRNFYKQLLSKYRRVVEGRLGWVRNTKVKEMCYNSPSNIEETPSMILQFDGENANLVLKPHNIWRYTDFNGMRVACFAFEDATPTGINFLGSTQQQNIRVVYEGGDLLRVGFDPSGC